MACNLMKCGSLPVTACAVTQQLWTRLPHLPVHPTPGLLLYVCVVLQEGNNTDTTVAGSHHTAGCGMVCTAAHLTPVLRPSPTLPKVTGFHAGGVLTHPVLSAVRVTNAPGCARCCRCGRSPHNTSMVEALHRIVLLHNTNLPLSRLVFSRHTF
jgi:hypothetical protein